MQKSVWTFLAAALVTGLVACGGENIIGQGNAGGQSNSISTMGTITAFGSVIVNGVHYDVSGAPIVRNGESVAQSQLAVGQIAKIRGTHNSDATGQADRVDVDDALMGPITSINATLGSLVALGQTVTVDSNTSFDRGIVPSGLSGLGVGDTINISGFAASNRHIVATRIERHNNSTFQVIGAVAAIDATARTFLINAMTVDYSSANVSGFASGVPANGDVVEVQGTSFDSLTTTLTAAHVAAAADETSNAGQLDDIEREGLITRFASATDFDVAGKPVTITSSTTFEGGVATDMALNVRVEIEGSLDTNDVLQAQKVQIENAGIVELSGNITAVDTAAGTVVLLGTLATVTGNTRFEDMSDAAVLQFSLASLVVGDTIDVRGFEDPVGSGNITVTRLEREPPSSTELVGGFYVATTAPQFSILGLTIDATSSNLVKDWQTTMTSNAFFSQAPGNVVFAFGTLSGTTLKATRTSLSLRDDCEDQLAHENDLN